MSGYTVRECAKCSRRCVTSAHYAEARQAEPTITRYKARGLCNACFCAEHKAGTLDDWETDLCPAHLVLDDWAILRDQGHTVRDAAPRLGMTAAALDKALERAKRRGDPRGHRRPQGRDGRDDRQWTHTWRAACAA